MANCVSAMTKILRLYKFTICSSLIITIELIVGALNNIFLMFVVPDGPQFMSKSQYVAADVGDTATLTCQVDSNPPPAIIWTRSHSPRILSSSNIFSLLDVARGDFGTYTCMASVIGFEEITMDVRLLEKGTSSLVA